MMTAA
jgi:leucyl aminopeptidase